MEKLMLDFFYGREAEQFTFYRLPKVLITDKRFKDISNNSKLLYGLMLDRMSLSKKSGWLDDENRVFIKYSLENIAGDLGISKKTAGIILKELEASGLVDIVQKSGKSNLIYVKNFISDSNSGSKGTKKDDHFNKKEADSLQERDASCNQCDFDTGVKFTPVEKLHRCSSDAGTGEKNTPVPGEFLPPNNNENNTEVSENSIVRSYHELDALLYLDNYIRLCS